MFSDADLLEMHRRMLVIRGFEERVAALYRDGEVPGFVHLSIGQEASAVGACWPLAPDRRDHVDASRPRPLPREGSRPARDVRRADGQGRGHEPRPRRLDAHRRPERSASSARTGSSAAGLPIAVGAATAAQLRRDGSVAVAFFGDGAVAHGTFHEAINLAAVWQLPVIFFCENNGYAEFSPASAQHAAPLERRAAGYGVDYVAVDGNDVVATAAAMTHGGRRRRAPGSGPVVVEAATYRWHGHYEGDPQRYRSPDEVREWEARDPLLVHARRLRSAGVADDALEAMQSAVARELDDAVDAARRLAAPAAATLTDFVVAPARRTAPSRRPLAADAPVFRTMDAIRSRARSRARGRRARVRRRDRRRARAATCSA